MKSYCILFLIFALVSCDFNRIDPSVDTLRIEPLFSIDEREVDMAVQLYHHYTQSDKSKEFYEVIVERTGAILNYWPEKQLLTVCANPGSNWLGQYKEIDTTKLKWIGDNKINFSQYRDSLMINRPTDTRFVKTNGNP
ncbi:hypothetical protein [Salmonirosea aquatica]